MDTLRSLNLLPPLTYFHVNKQRELSTLCNNSGVYCIMYIPSNHVKSKTLPVNHTQTTSHSNHLVMKEYSSVNTG